MTYAYYFTFFVHPTVLDPFADFSWEDLNQFMETCIESNSPEPTKELMEKAKESIRKKLDNFDTLNFAIIAVVRTLNVEE